MKVRKAVLVDLDRLKEIEDKVFKQQGIAESRFTLKSRITAFPGGCFVITENSQVVGYALSELRRKITRFSLNNDARTTHSKSGPYLYLATLAVDPKFQGRGIGEKLLKKITSLAKRKDLKSVLLATWFARYYYPRFGFKIYRKIYNKKGKISYYIFQKELR